MEVFIYAIYAILILAIILVPLAFLSYAIFLIIENWGHSYKTTYRRILYYGLGSFLFINVAYSVPVMNSKMSDKEINLQRGTFIDTVSNDTITLSFYKNIGFYYKDKSKDDFNSSYHLEGDFLDHNSNFSWSKVISNVVKYSLRIEPKIKNSKMTIHSPGKNTHRMYYFTITPDELILTPMEEGASSVSYLRYKGIPFTHNSMDEFLRGK